MDYSSQEKTSMPSAEQENIGFSAQPPAYSSLPPPTQEYQPVPQPTQEYQPVPQPAQQYQPIPQPVQPTNIIYMVGQPQVGPDPTTMTCPHCQATVTSMVNQEPSTKTHLACLLLCLLGCCCCAPLVYCTDGCMAKKHSCPNCNQFLGVYDG